MARALVLFSGGLDSLLAARLLRDLCDGVTAVCFTSPFFGSDDARKGARDLGIELVEEDLTGTLIGILLAPRHGFGKNMNPCVDCHTAMIAAALAKLEEWGADFLATGEVLGERPMSQNRRALETVARESGAGDLLLRPLSAKLLPPTRPERRGGGPGRPCCHPGRSRSPRWSWRRAGMRVQVPRGGPPDRTRAFAGGCGAHAKVPASPRRPGAAQGGAARWSGKHRLVLGGTTREPEAGGDGLPTDHLSGTERPGPTALVGRSRDAPSRKLRGGAALRGATARHRSRGQGRGRAPAGGGALLYLDLLLHYVYMIFKIPEADEKRKRRAGREAWTRGYDSRRVRRSDGALGA